MKEPFCYYWGTTLDDIPGNYRETCPAPDLGWHGCDGCEMICTEEEKERVGRGDADVGKEERDGPCRTFLTR